MLFYGCSWLHLLRYFTGLPTEISAVMKQSAGPPSLHHDLPAVFKIVIL